MRKNWVRPPSKLESAVLLPSPVRCRSSVVEEIAPGIKRIEGKLQVEIPDYLLDGLDEKATSDIKEVVNALEKVKIIRYLGKTGSYWMVITQGVHGEETKRSSMKSDLTVEIIDKVLRSGLCELRGYITLISNVNAPGCARKNPTRWVFTDEKLSEFNKVDNLNNVFDAFKDGTWSEFLSLTEVWNPKTTMYAWLFMAFLTAQFKDYEARTTIHVQEKSIKAILLDLHRNDRVTIPTLFIDWFKDEKLKVKELAEEIKVLEFPQFLEGDDWYEQRLYETLTASANTQGFLAYTIEDTNMYNPDPSLTKYSAYQIEKFLEKIGVCKFPEEKREEVENILEALYKETPILRSARRVWERRKRSDRLLNVYRSATLFDSNNNTLSSRNFLERLSKNAQYQGVVTVSYRYNIVGKEGCGRMILVGEGVFGKERKSAAGKLGRFPEFSIIIPGFPDGHHVVSLQESPFSGNKLIYYGCYLNEDIVEFRAVEPLTQYKRLTTGELREKLRDPNLKIDISNIGPVCAQPDNRLT